VREGSLLQSGGLKYEAKFAFSHLTLKEDLMNKQELYNTVKKLHEESNRIDRFLVQLTDGSFNWNNVSEDQLQSIEAIASKLVQVHVVIIAHEALKGS
jgi:hypothetical protein